MARKSLRIGQKGEITARRVDQNRWKARCHYKDSDGRRKEMSRFGRTKSSAIGKLNDDWLEYSKRILNGQPAVAAPTTVSQLFDRWVTYEWKRSSTRGYPTARTLRNRHSVMTNHVLPRIGEVHVTELTAGGLNDMLTDIPRPDGRYLATAVQVKAALVRFCQYAVFHQLLSTNLARELEAVGYQPPEPRPLSAEEITRIRVAVSRWQQDKPNTRVPVLDVIDFMLGTGCRIGEALGIQWEHVHLNDPVPWVRIEFAVIYDRYDTSALGKTKAKKILHVALPIFAAEMLYRRWAATGYPELGLVFHRRSGRPYTSGEISTAAQRAMGDEVIVEDWDGGFKSHALRKSVLNSVNNVFGTAAAAEQGGHSSEATTKKFYLAPNVKTINYTSSLHQLLGMEEPVLAEVPEDPSVIPDATAQPDWIPADVRRVAESLLRGETPHELSIKPADTHHQYPELPPGDDDSLIVDEAPATDETDTNDPPTDSAMLDEQIQASRYWAHARARASNARVRDSFSGGVVVVDGDTQAYSPPKPGRTRISTTKRLRNLRTPRIKENG